MRTAVRIMVLAGPIAAAASAGFPNPTARIPLSDPFFSIDLSSPEVVNGFRDAGDILIPFGPVGFPTVAIPAANHRLNHPLDELDALSNIVPFGSFERGPQPTFALLFSVDRFAQGSVPPEPALEAAGFPFNVQDQADFDREQAAGDAFMALTLFDRDGVAGSPFRAVNNNTLVFNHGDAGGIDYNIAPAMTSPDEPAPQPISDADASMDFGESASLGGDGARGAGHDPFYFSVSRQSPSLPSLPGTNSGADVYVDDLPDQPFGERLYVPPGPLGLFHDDDINAMIVFDDGDRIFESLIDQVIFTLTPESPHAQGPFGPGDVLMSRGGGVFTLFASANRLGVFQQDVVDMLDYVPCANIMTCVSDWAIGYNCDCPGDTNCNGIVDLADLASFLAGFGHSSNSAYYNERLDFNLDLDVDLADLAYLLTNFGNSCSE